MKEVVSDKIRKRPISTTFLGIIILALLTILSIVATSNIVAAAETEFKDYIPQYNCAGINI